MNNNNLLSGRDKELQKLAEQYEAAMSENKSFYRDADDLADLADWYGIRRKFDKAFEITKYGLKLHPDNTGLTGHKSCSWIAGKRIRHVKLLIISLIPTHRRSKYCAHTYYWVKVNWMIPSSC